MNAPRPDVSVVVPALNEEKRLRPTLDEIVDYFHRVDRPFEVIVVDDGSTDGTSALVRALADRSPEIRLIRLPENRGKGFAVRAGMVNAVGRRLLFTDADGATPIAEIERLEAELDGGADLAVGSRAVPGHVRVVARWYRRAIGRIFHGLVRTLTIRSVVDTQCGFKLFEARVAQDLFSTMRMAGFAFDVEILLMAERRGYTISEVPVNWTHVPGSRVNLATDSLRMAFDLFVIRSNAMRGLYAAPNVALLEGREPAPVDSADPDPGPGPR